MNRNMAQHTIKHYVCARCWGHLDECLIDGEYIVKCMNPNCDGAGYHTKYYAENRRQENAFEASDVRKMLQDAGVIENPHAGKSEQQMLKELGY